MLQLFDLSIKSRLGRVIMIKVGDSECPVHLIHQHCNSISEQWSEGDMKTLTENMASLLHVDKCKSWKAGWSLWQTMRRGRLQPESALRENTDTQRRPANTNKINEIKSKPLLGFRYGELWCLQVWRRLLIQCRWKVLHTRNNNNECLINFRLLTVNLKQFLSFWSLLECENLLLKGFLTTFNIWNSGMYKNDQ